MEEGLGNLNNSNAEKAKEVAKALEQMQSDINVIDMEIVRLGENISKSELDELTRKKSMLTKAMAMLKGEKIDKSLRGYT